MKRKDTHKSGADSGDVASPAANEQTNIIPDPKALSRATKILGDKPKRSTFSKNVEKMLRALKKGEKS